MKDERCAKVVGKVILMNLPRMTEPPEHIKIRNSCSVEWRKE